MTRDALLDHMALVAREVSVLGSHGTVTIMELVLGRLPPPRAWHRQ